MKESKQPHSPYKIDFKKRVLELMMHFHDAIMYGSLTFCLRTHGQTPTKPLAAKVHRNIHWIIFRCICNDHTEGSFPAQQHYARSLSWHFEDDEVADNILHHMISYVWFAHPRDLFSGPTNSSCFPHKMRALAPLHQMATSGKLAQRPTKLNDLALTKWSI